MRRARPPAAGRRRGRAARPRPAAPRPPPAAGRGPRCARARPGARRSRGRVRAPAAAAGRARRPRRTARRTSPGRRRAAVGDRLAAEAVEDLAVLVALPEPPLVGLAVDRHQRLRRSRRGRPTGVLRPPTWARERPSAADRPAPAAAPSSSTSAPASLGADERRAGPPGTLTTGPRPRPRGGRPAPGRRRRASPRSSPRPETTMVLPAPVSPVTTLRPGLSSRTASSMTPTPWIRTSSNTPPTLGARAAPVSGRSRATRRR